MKYLVAKLQCTVTKTVTLQVPDHMTAHDINHSNIWEYSVNELEVDQIDYKIATVVDSV